MSPVTAAIWALGVTDDEMQSLGDSIGGVDFCVVLQQYQEIEEDEQWNFFHRWGMSSAMFFVATTVRGEKCKRETSEARGISWARAAGERTNERPACERAAGERIRCLERPAQNGKLKTTGSERPALNDRLRTTGSERPAQNDRLRKTGSERPAQNYQLITSSERPAHNACLQSSAEYTHSHPPPPCSPPPLPR